jgi:hypothetical protein
VSTNPGCDCGTCESERAEQREIQAELDRLSEAEGEWVLGSDEELALLSELMSDCLKERARAKARASASNGGSAPGGAASIRPPPTPKPGTAKAVEGAQARRPHHDVDEHQLDTHGYVRRWMTFRGSRRERARDLAADPLIEALVRAWDKLGHGDLDGIPDEIVIAVQAISTRDARAREAARYARRHPVQPERSPAESSCGRSGDLAGNGSRSQPPFRPSLAQTRSEGPARKGGLESRNRNDDSADSLLHELADALSALSCVNDRMRFSNAVYQRDLISANSPTRAARIAQCERVARAVSAIVDNRRAGAA